MLTLNLEREPVMYYGLPGPENVLSLLIAAYYAPGKHKLARSMVVWKRIARLWVCFWSDGQSR